MPNFVNLTVVAAFLALSLAAQVPQKQSGDGVNFYSLEKEIALGQQMAGELEKQAKILVDPAVVEYVNRVAQSLARNSDAKLPIVVKVIEDDSVNSYALPGGFLYVNTGLIRKVQGEAELAGALAHGIAHVAARHETRNQTKAQIASQATVPMIFMGGGWGAYSVGQAQSVLLPTSFLKFSRQFEVEADTLALQYLYKTGYDPAGYVSLLERTQIDQKASPGANQKMFSSHPPSADLIKDAQKTIETFAPRTDYLATSPEFRAAQARLERQ